MSDIEKIPATAPYKVKREQGGGGRVERKIEST